MPLRVPSTNSTTVSFLLPYKHILNDLLNKKEITRDQYIQILNYYGLTSKDDVAYWLTYLNFHQQKQVYAKKQ
jgi:hypothetical protein